MRKELKIGETVPALKRNERKRVLLKKAVPIKKVAARPIATKVSKIRLQNGALFILPERTVKGVLSFFKGKTVQQLTTMPHEENRRVALALERMPPAKFESLVKNIHALRNISSSQAIKYFSGEVKGIKSTPMPFEDLMQDVELVRMLKKSNLKL